MLKNISAKRILPIIFLSTLSFVFLIQAIAATALILIPATALADSTFTFEVPILHGQQQTITFNSKSGTKPIADYIKSIYTFAVGAVGIVAAVVLMIGGVMWITAGGNASSVSEATSMIKAALTGMVLVLCSYLILGQINPALVDLQTDLIGTPTPIPLSTTLSCNWTDIGKLSSLGGAVGGAGSFSAGQQQTTVVGNCSDKGMTESVGGKDCDASKYPTDQAAQQYTKCCCSQSAAGGWTYQPGVALQQPDASPALNSLINCLKQNITDTPITINSISDNHIVGHGDDWNYCTINYPGQCLNDNSDSAACCYHLKNSCHYGGTPNPIQATQSYAVDLGGDQSIITAAANGPCKSYVQYVGQEGTHVHISAVGCPNSN